jgi:uncharacterized repeat protein (TIGR01451 family)
MRRLKLFGGRRGRWLSLSMVLAATLAATLAGSYAVGSRATTTATGTYYFHGQAADQANKVNAPGTATFDQTAPTSATPVTQQTTGVANQDFAGNPLTAYWSGPFSGTVDGALTLKWYWSSSATVQPLIDVSVFADPDWNNATGTLIGRAQLSLTGAGPTPQLFTSVVPVSGTVAKTLLIQVAAHFSDASEGMTVYYDSADMPSSFSFGAAPPPPPNPAPPVSFDTSSGIAFAPATLVSAHFLCGEPQETLERGISGSHAGAVSNNRIYSDCPLTSRSQTSLLSRSNDGGQSFRLLLDPACPQRNRPNCMTLGGGDSEEDVNLVTGNLYFADQEGLTVQEGLASSTDHGDSFPAARQFAITNATTATDRQWLAWVDPRNATVAGQSLEGFFSWHLPAAGQYVLGIGPNGIPLPQPVPQIPLVGQSGQMRVDNADTSPGRGWIYQPFRSTGGAVSVATAFAPQYQNPAAWVTTTVSSKGTELFPWIGIDDSGNAYLTFVFGGQLYLSASPISDPRNDPRQGGRPGTFWTPEAQVNPPSIHSTAFPEVTAGAGGRIAVGYMGSPDCAVGKSDNCATSSHWNTYVDVIQDATQLWKGGTTNIQVAQVNHRVAHLGTVCTSGTTCSGDRSLLDMMDIGYDSTGRIGVVYMDNNNALGNVSDTTKNSPFVEFAKQVSGPSLTGGTVAVTIPRGGRDDPAGDATWPNTASGTNLKALDLLGASIDNSATTLTATVKLADASKAGMQAALDAFNAVNPLDQRARLQYIVRFETGSDVYHLDLEYQNGSLRYFGGKLDANDGVQNGTNTVVGARYVTDAGYHVSGSLGNGQLTLSIPLADLGLAIGDTIRNVSAFATAEPSEDDTTASLIIDSGRTIDATPPFDATLAPPPSADIAVAQTASPNPVGRGKPETFTITVANAGPSDASGVTLADTLPTNTSFKSAGTSQGSCSSSSGAVNCSLGGLANGASAKVTIVVVPKAKGTITNTASAHAASPPDPNGANNTASATVTVK